jgi:hypothetical protein
VTVALAKWLNRLSTRFFASKTNDEMVTGLDGRQSYAISVDTVGKLRWAGGDLVSSSRIFTSSPVRG